MKYSIINQILKVNCTGGGNTIATVIDYQNIS